MPELPEVEIVRRGLEADLAGRRLTRVEARRADLRLPFPERFVERLTGARVGSLARRGKYILAALDRGETLIVHLGMSGRFKIDDTDDGGGDPPHAHVVFITDASRRLLFIDPRRFGLMDLVDSDALGADRRFAGMGPEPLEPGFTAEWLRRGLAGGRQAIKTRLLDQRLVAGLGNIYICEALHRARIAPTTPAGEVGRAALGRLERAVRDVLAEAIAAGGSSLRDFAHTDGARGGFQHGFDVYGRRGAACPRRGCAGFVERIVQTGRSTFFCPVCQR